MAKVEVWNSANYGYSIDENSHHWKQLHIQGPVPCFSLFYVLRKVVDAQLGKYPPIVPTIIFLGIPCTGQEDVHNILQRFTGPISSPTGGLTMKQLCQNQSCTHPNRNKNHEQIPFLSFSPITIHDRESQKYAHYNGIEATGAPLTTRKKHPNSENIIFWWAVSIFPQIFTIKTNKNWGSWTSKCWKTCCNQLDLVKSCPIWLTHWINQAERRSQQFKLRLRAGSIGLWRHPRLILKKVHVVFVGGVVREPM